MAGRLTALAIVAALFAATPAQADVLRNGPYRYVSAEREASGFSTLKANCPRKTHVLSGGAFTAAAFNDAHLIHSYPFDSKDRKRAPDDGWKVLMNGRFDIGTPTSVYAICRREMPTYEVGDHVATADEQTHGTVSCPKGLSVTGGGTNGDLDVPEVSSLPVDGSPDEWEFWVDNRDSDSLNHTLNTFAICVDRELFVLQAEGTVAAGALETESRQCAPGDYVVGGGYYTSANYDESKILASAPFAFDSDANDGWQARIANRTSTTMSVTSYAICHSTAG